MDADGKQFQQPLQRLVSVDEAPDEPGNGACHYEPAGNQLAAEPEATVGFDAHAHGVGETP